MENKNIEKLMAEYNSVVVKINEEKEKLKSINDQIRAELERENREFCDSMKGKILLADSDSKVVILVVEEIDFMWNRQDEFKWTIFGKEYSYLLLEEGYCKICNKCVRYIPDRTDVCSLAEVKEYIAKTYAEISKEELQKYKDIILERFIN